MCHNMHNKCLDCVAAIDAAIAQIENLANQFTVIFYLADTNEVTNHSAIRDSAGRGLMGASKAAQRLKALRDKREPRLTSHL
jgi:hypothetical protein